MTRLSFRDEVSRIMDHGFEPIPIHGVVTEDFRGKITDPHCSCDAGHNCGAPGKKSVWTWSHYNKPETRRVNAHDVDAWLDRFRYHPFDRPLNVAAHMGRSGRVGLDTDPRNGGRENFQAMIEKYGPLPTTQKDSTLTRGWHNWFAAPPDGALPSKTCIELAPGVELKHGKTYIILPPSMHICGHRYEWEVGCAPWEIDLAPLPQWIIDLANEIAARREKESDPEPNSNPEPIRYSPAMFGNNYSGNDLMDRVRLYINTIGPSIQGHDGNRPFYTVACKLVIDFGGPDGLTRTDAEQLFREWNRLRASPLWSENEIQHALDTAESQPGERGRLVNRPRSDPAWLPGGEFAGLANLTEITIVHRPPPPPPPPIYHDYEEIAAALTTATPTDAAADAIAGATIASAWKDYIRHPCQSPYSILQENCEDGHLRVLWCRCQKRSCEPCRQYLVRRDLINIQTRLTAAVTIHHQPIHSFTCPSQSDWDRWMSKAVQRAGGKYFKISAGDGTFLIISTAPLAGSTPITVEDAVRRASFLLELHRESKPAVTQSRVWSLNSLRTDYPNYRNIGQLPPTVDDDFIHDVSDHTNVPIKIFTPASGEGRIIAGAVFAPCVPIVAAWLLACLRYGQLLAKIEDEEEYVVEITCGGEPAAGGPLRVKKTYADQLNLSG